MGANSGLTARSHCYREILFTCHRMRDRIYGMDDGEVEITYFYHPSRECLGQDGSIHIDMGFYGKVEMGCGAQVSQPGDADYEFWRWLVNHADFQRMVNGEELIEAQQLFKLECSFE